MTDNSGAAFPQIAELGDIGYRTSGGMTLRDWFAGQALTGILADESHIGTYHSLAQNAYEVADAMLAARTSGTGVGK